MKEQPGYIYLIKAGEHYKIGKSTNVAQRMRQFQLPIPIELLHTITVPNMSRAESHLHRRFADQRVHGEWFALCPGDITWICSLETLDPPQEQPKRKVAPQVAPQVAPAAPMQDSSRPDLMLAGKAAEYLGVSRQRLHYLTKTGRLEPKTRIGGVAFYSREELDAYKGEREVKSADLIPSPVIRAAA